MDFGSKYIYKYQHSSDESLSDEDVEHDAEHLFVPNRSIVPLPGATVEGMEVTDTALAPVPTSAASAQQNKGRRRLRKADTNVLSVRFNQLLLPGEMHAGDPVRCGECGAIASHLSKIQPGNPVNNTTEEVATVDEGLSKWQCEFCPHLNTVDIEQNDLPKQEDATYLITPAPVVHGSDMTGVDDSMVFFLIDISGSMSSTTLVQGNFQLPNAIKLQERAAEQFGGERMVRRRNETHVSRLQGVQMAVDVNLDKLVKDAPTRRAALLTFNHEITYYGDGTRDEPLVIRGDKLNSTEDLLREAEREHNNELKPVAQTKTKLSERVYDLEEGGQTALGPAVAFALNIAAKRTGSKIVICTDGLANRGLGNLETANDDKAEEAVKKQALEEGNHFYGSLTERAREAGVSISVITIKGTNCLLPVIGQMADGTGGNVTIVDLLNIRNEFASILEQQTIATNVEATLIVHRGLYIRNPSDPDEKLEKAVRDVGNVTKQTEITFEFGVRNKEELKEKYQIDLDQLQQLPFQLQVIYTATDGSKALRVLTQLKEATENREIAEINAVRSVIAENHIRSTANDMMAAYSDEEEDNDYALRARSKWSSPLMQKQRLMYMDKLNAEVRRRNDDDGDEFNEGRWGKASHELKSHVVSSKHRKAAAKRREPAAAPGLLGTLGSRVSRMFGASSSESAAPPTETGAVVEAAAPQKRNAMRSYGFATSKLSNFSDTHSEDLYRYKNMSSDYMRSTSPTRQEADREEAAARGGPAPPALRNRAEFALDEENSDDEHKPSASPSSRHRRSAKK